MDYGLIYRALRTHELALKQAINDSNNAVAEIAKRPFRAPDGYLLARRLDEKELDEILDELSRVAMLRLEIERMFD